MHRRPGPHLPPQAAPGGPAIPASGFHACAVPSRAGSAPVFGPAERPSWPQGRHVSPPGPCILWGTLSDGGWQSPSPRVSGRPSASRTRLRAGCPRSRRAPCPRRDVRGRPQIGTARRPDEADLIEPGAERSPGSAAGRITGNPCKGALRHARRLRTQKGLEGPGPCEPRGARPCITEPTPFQDTPLPRQNAAAFTANRARLDNAGLGPPGTSFSGSPFGGVTARR